MIIVTGQGDSGRQYLGLGTNLKACDIMMQQEPATAAYCLLLPIYLRLVPLATPVAVCSCRCV